MNTKAVGELSEGMILSRLLQCGITVSLPFGNNQRYDMILDDGRALEKAQCKTGRLRNGVVEFNTCSVNAYTGKRKQYRGQADVFLVYCADNNEVYKVPVRLTGKAEFKLRLTPSKNGQKQRVNFADNFKLARSSVDRAVDS